MGAQLSALEQAGFELLDHHILALREDKDIINEALKALPKKKRPGLSAEHGTSVEQGGNVDPKYSMELEDMDDESCPAVVEESSFATDSSLFFPTMAGDPRRLMDDT